LIAGGILPAIPDPFPALIHAIAVISQGDNKARAGVEKILTQLETQGWHLTAAVHALWNGQRDPILLTVGLDSEDTTILCRTLALVTEAEESQRRIAILTRAENAVAALGDNPQARADLVERLRTAAEAYTNGSMEEQTLARRLRELAVQVKR
jgi:hypothetical protein